MPLPTSKTTTAESDIGQSASSAMAGLGTEPLHHSGTLSLSPAHFPTLVQSGSEDRGSVAEAVYAKRKTSTTDTAFNLPRAISGLVSSGDQTASAQPRAPTEAQKVLLSVMSPAVNPNENKAKRSYAAIVKGEQEASSASQSFDTKASGRSRSSSQRSPKSSSEYLTAPQSPRTEAASVSSGNEYHSAVSTLNTQIGSSEAATAPANGRQATMAVQLSTSATSPSNPPETPDVIEKEDPLRISLPGTEEGSEATSLSQGQGLECMAVEPFTSGTSIDSPSEETHHAEKARSDQTLPRGNEKEREPIFPSQAQGLESMAIEPLTSESSASPSEKKDPTGRERAVQTSSLGNERDHEETSPSQVVPPPTQALRSTSRQCFRRHQTKANRRRARNNNAGASSSGVVEGAKETTVQPVESATQAGNQAEGDLSGANVGQPVAVNPTASSPQYQPSFGNTYTSQQRNPESLWTPALPFSTRLQRRHSASAAIGLTMAANMSTTDALLRSRSNSYPFLKRDQSPHMLLDTAGAPEPGNTARARMTVPLDPAQAFPASSIISSRSYPNPSFMVPHPPYQLPAVRPDRLPYPLQAAALTAPQSPPQLAGTVHNSTPTASATAASAAANASANARTGMPGIWPRRERTMSAVDQLRESAFAPGTGPTGAASAAGDPAVNMYAFYHQIPAHFASMNPHAHRQPHVGVGVSTGSGVGRGGVSVVDSAAQPAGSYHGRGGQRRSRSLLPLPEIGQRQHHQFPALALAPVPAPTRVASAPAPAPVPAPAASATARTTAGTLLQQPQQRSQRSTHLNPLANPYTYSQPYPQPYPQPHPQLHPQPYLQPYLQSHPHPCYHLLVPVQGFTGGTTTGTVTGTSTGGGSGAGGVGGVGGSTPSGSGRSHRGPRSRSSGATFNYGPNQAGPGQSGHGTGHGRGLGHGIGQGRGISDGSGRGVGNGSSRQGRGTGNGTGQGRGNANANVNANANANASGTGNGSGRGRGRGYSGPSPYRYPGYAPGVRPRSNVSASPHYDPYAVPATLESVRGFRPCGHVVFEAAVEWRHMLCPDCDP